MPKDIQTILGEIDNVAAFAGRSGEVRTFIEERLEPLEMAFGQNSREYALVLNELGTYERMDGCFDESEATLRLASEIIEKLVNSDDADDDLLEDPAMLRRLKIEYAGVLCNYGGTCRLMGKLDEASKQLSDSVELYRDALGEGALCGSALNDLALVRQDQGRFDEALDLHLQVAKMLDSDHGATADFKATNLYNLGMCRFLLRRELDKARHELDEAADFFEGSRGSDNPMALLARQVAQKIDHMSAA